MLIIGFYYDSYYLCEYDYLEGTLLFVDNISVPYSGTSLDIMHSETRQTFFAFYYVNGEHRVCEFDLSIYTSLERSTWGRIKAVNMF